MLNNRRLILMTMKKIEMWKKTPLNISSVLLTHYLGGGVRRENSACEQCSCRSTTSHNLSGSLLTLDNWADSRFISWCKLSPSSLKRLTVPCSSTNGGTLQKSLRIFLLEATLGKYTGNSSPNLQHKNANLGFSWWNKVCFFAISQQASP